MNAQDKAQLRAAEGWLALGDCASAFEELDRVSPPARSHSAILKLRWRIYAKAGKWGNAYTVAEGLSRLEPDDSQPYVWRSYSARRMKGGGIGLALELLLDVVNDFPDEPLLPFNIACYQCQLGNLDEAKAWMHTALEVADLTGHGRELRARTFAEPDLAELQDGLCNG